jgi:GH35 family endo-1,4-beta-xylanase
LEGRNQEKSVIFWGFCDSKTGFSILKPQKTATTDKIQLLFDQNALINLILLAWQVALSARLGGENLLLPLRHRNPGI